MAHIYLMCYVLDPFIYAYDCLPLIVYPKLVPISRFSTVLIIVDMLLDPFIAKPKIEKFSDVSINNAKKTSLKTIRANKVQRI